MNYGTLFGTSLPGGIPFLILLFLPTIIAYWKGKNSIRFLTLPLVLFAWFLGAMYDFTSLLVCWLIAWLCVVLSFRENDGSV
jgi:hypothetical protein